MNPPCTFPGCDEPTQNYLCHTCVQELADAQEAVPDLIPTLVLIARKEETPFTHPTARTGGGGGKAGPGEPVHLGAIALIQHFEDMEPAPQYALHPKGADRRARTLQLIRNADIMVNGEKENKPTDDYVNYRLKDVHPMPVKYLLPWLAEKAGVRLSKKAVNKWANRGKLERQNSTGHPTYRPADVLAAHHDDRRR